MTNQGIEDLFRPFSLGALQSANRFVFPPVKLGVRKCGRHRDGPATSFL